MAENKKKNEFEIKITTYESVFAVADKIANLGKNFEDEDSFGFIQNIAVHCNYAGISLSDAIQNILSKYGVEESFVKPIIETVYKENISENGSKALMYNLKVRNSFDNEDWQKLPYIPDEAFSSLPMIIKKGTDVFNDKRERDSFLLGALVVSGGILQTFGLYRGKKSRTNLYCFVVAPASAGKGAFLLAKRLGLGFHKYMRDNHQSLLFLPGNISTAALYQILEKTAGKGIFFESEADSMANSFKQDWGGYSDILRKGFHYESITHQRKMEDKYIEIEYPVLSLALSGTWGQIKGIIGNTEDGLFSRFVFYTFKSEPYWDRFSDEKDFSLDDFFDEYQKEYENLVTKAMSVERFSFTEQQKKIFHDRFEKWQNEFVIFYDDESISIIRRLAEITFRIAMILSVIRYAEEADEISQGTIIHCTDTDFNIAFLLAEVIKQHNLFVFVKFSSKESKPIDKAVQMFFENLPSNEFQRAEAVNIGKQKVKIEERTVDKYLRNLLRAGYLIQPSYGTYKKKI